MRDFVFIYRSITLICEHIDVVVAITCDVCMDQSAVCDGDFDNICRAYVVRKVDYIWDR
jgi:hypothetical protein